MLITQEIIQTILEDLNSNTKRKKRDRDFKRFKLFNGEVHDVVMDSIKESFKKPETVNELATRVVTINIANKIVTKLAGVYLEDPIRLDKQRDIGNQASIQELEDAMDLNTKQKEANRYFKLYNNRNLQEIYLDDDGVPSLRNLPKHTYEAYSFSSVSPEIAQVIAKIVKDSSDIEKQEIHLWSDESFIVIDGKGTVKNQETENKYGILPFVYNNAATYSVDPMEDDSLLEMSVMIPLLLTDILFALKYQCWSIIVAIGFDQEIPFNPNSVVSVQRDTQGNAPEIKTIKPEVDSDKALTIIKELLSYLLSTKNLSVATVSAQVTTDNAVSGVSKMLDASESIEDKKDQQAYFRKAEKNLWDKIAKLCAYWKSTNELSDKVSVNFSDDFAVQIIFKEPTPLLSEDKKIELADKKLKAGLSTLKRELRSINPNMDAEEIDELAEEIQEERHESSPMGQIEKLTEDDAEEV